MHECIGSLRKARIFVTLNENSGYRNIEIEESDRNKTVFTSHRGLYRALRMPFGLHDAPGTIRRSMEVILATAKWRVALVYLKGKVRFYKTQETHIRYIRKVLTLLKNAGVVFKLKKCQLCAETVDYLRHLIRRRRLELQPYTTVLIGRPQEETDLMELRSILGL